MSRGPALTPLERMLKGFGDRIVARLDRVDARMDVVEARLAQGQHDVSSEVQSMFTEMQSVMGETRDEVAKLGARVGNIERADDIAKGVADEMEKRNAHDAVIEKGALSTRAWKPPSWPTVATVTGIGAVVGILANLHSAAVVIGHIAKAIWGG
jgi:hypothetical protein